MRKKSAVGGEAPVEKGQAGVKIKWEVGRYMLPTTEVECKKNKVGKWVDVR
jgi:hypothetical protein